MTLLQNMMALVADRLSLQASQRFQPNWKRTTCLIALLALVFIPKLASQAQTISGGPANRPLLEPIPGRPAPSQLEQRFLANRPDDDKESIGQLVRNVQDSDAVLEVVVGRSRILTFKEPLVSPGNETVPVVAVGDPTVLEFDILPSTQMMRILGRQVGSTDLSVVSASGQVFTFEVHVVYDLNYLRAYLKQLYPNAMVQVSQLQEHLIVEGEASSVDQSARIIETVENYLRSAQVSRSIKGSSGPRGINPAAMGDTGQAARFGDEGGNGQLPAGYSPFLIGSDDKPDVTSEMAPAQIINLIRVPGVQQVMLQVKIAEVNRTALREMGSNLFYQDSSGRTVGFLNGGSGPIAGDEGNLLGLSLGSSTTSFAIFPNTTFAATFEALRSNQVISILAEPNLMAMHGQKASFLAGGEFPVPVPQQIGQGGNATFTVQFKEFGVLLDFIPYIMDDGAIRLHVAPEVSTIDPALGVVAAGIAVPGVNTRRANTTVELHQGQTLALAGLIQVEMEGSTRRIPGLGDVPYLGAFFSNNSHQRIEKELVILVSPFLVSGLEADQVGPLPGCEIADPTDREFYTLNRIESRTPQVNYRATNGWDNPFNFGKSKTKKQQSRELHGPFGYSR